MRFLAGFLARILKWPLLAAVLALGLTPGLPSAAPISLSVQTERVSLSGRLARLIDPTHDLTIADAIRADAAGAFTALPDFRGAGQTRDAHWYRFTLRRQAGAPSDWVLELGEAYIDRIDAHVVDGQAVDGSKVALYRLGDHVPYSQRPLKTRMHGLLLSLPEDRPVTVYLRIASISAISLTGSVWTPSAFIAHETRSLLLHGFFFGVLGLLVLLYIGLGAALQDGALGAYTGYVATLFTYYLGANGIAAVWFPDLPGWALNLLTGGSGLAGVAAAMVMWDRILNLRESFPRVSRFYRGFAVIALCTVPAAVTPYYALVNLPMVTVAMLVTLVSLILVVRLLLRHPEDISLRYYLAGFVVSLVGLTVSQLALRGGLPAEGLFTNAYQIASGTHVVILALGLSQRVRRLHADRIRARQETRFATKRAEQQRTFVAMLSHEFRTPLASIDSAAQMVETAAGPLPEPARRRLERIRATARRLGDLVDLFLSSDALDQGALALRPEPVPLSRMLDIGLGELAEADLSERVTVTGPAEDRVIHADPQFLAVALGNLVRNALRYSPPDAAVEVAAATGADGVSITVRDRGYGMSAEEVGRIGSMYFRAGSSAGTKGVGIGLYITRQIVAAHGGTLEVSSRVGEGSAFTIRLPAEAQTVPPAVTGTAR